MQLPPSPTCEFSISVIQTLKAAGFQALWAGGCVRDMLLGKTPKDFDVATNALPDQVRDLFGHERTLAVGASFGVITVLGGKTRGQIEVATFRSDAEYSDGRRPDSVRYTDAEEDSQRRDFTINGMFYDPIERRVLDFVGGRRDLSAGLVRSIGNPFTRFFEDKLRMLRAVRFTSTLQFELQLQTYRAIRAYADHISVVSAERIAAELRRMLADSNRPQAVRMLRDLNLMAQLFPELDATVGHAVWWSETANSLQLLSIEDFSAAMACLFRQSCAASLERVSDRRPLQPVSKICARLKLTNQETKSIQWLIRNERIIRAAHSVAWPQLQRLLTHEDSVALCSVARAVQLAKHEESSGINRADRCLQLPAEQLNPPPLVTGRDLIEAGFRPGPKFQTLLEAIRDEQLEGRVSSMQTALEFARMHWDQLAPGKST